MYFQASLEALHALYARTSFVDDDFVKLVVPMYDPKFIDLARKLFEWSSAVDPEDIDDDKYQFAKKFSEVSRHLNLALHRKARRGAAAETQSTSASLVGGVLTPCCR